MVVAMGMLEWPPETFWAATPHDMWAAVDGRKEANRVDDGKPAAPTDSEIAALMARFPDDNPDPALV